MSTVHVFVSYSHRDDTWVKEGTYGLIPWLAQQLKKNEVEIWYDHALKHLPGAEYRKLIKSEIDRAHLAILLISQDFVSSDFIREFELPWIRQRVERGELSLIPILVGPTLDEDLDWLADRQMLPGKPAPLVEYTESIAKWQAVRLDILGAIRDRAREIAARLPTEPSTGPARRSPPLHQPLSRSKIARNRASERSGRKKQPYMRQRPANGYRPRAALSGRRRRLPWPLVWVCWEFWGLLSWPSRSAFAIRSPPRQRPARQRPSATTPAGTTVHRHNVRRHNPCRRAPSRDRRRTEQLAAARAAYNGKNYALAMKLCEPLANQGNSETQY